MATASRDPKTLLTPDAFSVDPPRLPPVGPPDSKSRRDPLVVIGVLLVTGRFAVVSASLADLG